jgi:hypothetical protein
MPKILTQADRARIKERHAAGDSSKFLAEKYNVTERTIQRAVYGDKTLKRPKPGYPATHAPLPPAAKRQPPKVRRSAFLPKRVHEGFVERLPIGADLCFNRAGALARVERCPIYGPGHAAWRVATVDVVAVEDGVIRAVTHKWDGESITGQLVFDRKRLPAFYYDHLPRKAEKDAEKVRDRLAEAIRKRL